MDFRNSGSLPVVSRGVTVADARGDAAGSDPAAGRSRAGLQSPEAIPREPRGADPAPSAAHRAGLKGSCPCRVPLCGVSLPHQPYIVKEGQELLHQLHSEGAGLLPLQVTHHVSEDHQGLRLDICVAILEHLHDAWQEDLHLSCLYERQSFLFVKRSKTTLAKMLWSPSTSLLSGFLAGGGTGVSAAASW